MILLKKNNTPLKENYHHVYKQTLTLQINDENKLLVKSS